jgi:hypothetical protein
MEQADRWLISRWSFGSVLFLASWAVLMGPMVYLRHLLSGPRLPFTAAYFGSIGLTLFFSVGVSSHSLSRCPFQESLANSHSCPVAPPDFTYSPCCHCTVDMPGMVSCELFPPGQHRIEVCFIGRSQESNELDEWMIDWGVRYFGEFGACKAMCNGCWSRIRDVFMHRPLEGFML